MKFGCLLLMSSWLSACGFHLQGHAPQHLQLQHLPALNVVVREQDPRAQYAIRKQLASGGYQQSATGTRIVVHEVSFSARDISLTTRRQATEKELIATLRYAYLEKSEAIMTSRVFTEDPNAVLSSEKQRQALEQELIQELTERMLAQLSTALMQTHHETE